MGNQVQNLVPVGKAIYVQAYDPGIYLYSSRKAASRFTYPRSAEQMREILSDLAAGKAYALLIPETGAPEFDRWCDEACHQQLDEILSGFDRKGYVGRYRAWVRILGDNVETGESP